MLLSTWLPWLAQIIWKTETKEECSIYSIWCFKNCSSNSTSVSDCHCDTSAKTTVPMPFTDAQCQQLSKMIHDSIRQTTNWNLSSSASQMTGINSSSHYSCSVVTVHSVLSSDNSQSYTWILDSGATNHITCHRHILSDLKPLQAELYLLDGKTVAITNSGNLRLTTYIVLYDVLCVSAFNCNLISVAKLPSHPFSMLVFCPNTCVLQDLTLKKDREIGKLKMDYINFTHLISIVVRGIFLLSFWIKLMLLIIILILL